MEMKERNVLVRVLALFLGVIVIAAIAEILKLALNQFEGITIGGAVPAVILYGLPLIALMSWLGFAGGKKDTSNEPEPQPSSEKWTE
jgi:hypothetical protein